MEKLPEKMDILSQKMESLPKITEKFPKKNDINYHKVFQKRLDIKKAVSDLGFKDGNSGLKKKIYEKHYKEDEEALGEEASNFKIKELGGLSPARELLKRQKEAFNKEVAEEVIRESACIDYELIFKENPKLGSVLNKKEEIRELKDFRMKKIFELQNPGIRKAVKDRDEEVIETLKDEIINEEKELNNNDISLLQQAKFLEYKKNLSEAGHICITPGVEKDLEDIGFAMLSSKAIFLHGPTGTGKTSLAKYAGKKFTGKNPEIIYCNPQTRETNIWAKQGIRPVGSKGAMESVDILGP